MQINPVALAPVAVGPKLAFDPNSKAVPVN